MDLINRQAAIDAVTDELDVIDHVPQWVFDRLEKRLKQLPPAQPEQPTGKWIKGHCSECGDHAPYWAMSSAYYGSKFCPNCGAKMAEGDAK